MVAQELNSVMERHEAFWAGGGDRPLRRVSPYAPLSERGGIPLADGSRAEEGRAISPELIDPRRFYNENAEPTSVVNGDFIAGKGPPGLCWTEAILGCTVRIVTGGPWAESFFGDWAELEDLEPDGRWLEKLDAFVDFLTEHARGRYPIVQPLMRGPIDMMAAALGHERMCIALMESPDRTDAFLEFCSELFIQIAKRRLDRTPRFEDGYLSGYSIWAPGQVVRTQVDNGTMLSPAVYRERVLKYDRRVIEAFEYPLIHLHSKCLHLADELLQVEALKAIQVSIDYPGGPLVSDVLPVLERIIRKKPLIVTGPVSQDELRTLEALPHSGRLCMHVQLVGEETFEAETGGRPN